MSFYTIDPAPPRLNRCELAVPGNRPEIFEKAARSDADVLFLDLEDSVPPDEKENARRNVIEALGDIDWNGKSVSVRVNGLDTHYAYRDIVDVLEQAGEHVDLIMLPKAGTASDIYALDFLTTSVQSAKGRSNHIGFEIIIETALGMSNIHEIASASPRNESLHFGVADYAASTGARSTNIGGANPDYAILSDGGDNKERVHHLGDMWHYALARLVVAARTNGLRPVDGPFGDITDTEGLSATAKRVAMLGCEGKWAIHPSQIEAVNAAMTPSKSDIEQAKRILKALKDAEREGRGAVTLDGKLIDRVSIRQAETLLAKAEQLSKRK
ncbi:MAG: CoA ester lyase [Hyphomicrobiales bacterium]|nr:CoA ester lyase [Hyphomicrobiales bacterium]